MSTGQGVFRLLLPLLAAGCLLDDSCVSQTFPCGSQQGGGANPQNPAPGITNPAPLSDQQLASFGEALKCLCEAAKGLDTAPPGSTPAQQDRLKECKKAMQQACDDALGGGEPCDCGMCCDNKFPKDFCVADLTDADGGTPPDEIKNGRRFWTADPGNKMYFQRSNFDASGAYSSSDLKGRNLAPGVFLATHSLVSFHELYRCRQVASTGHPNEKWEEIVDDGEVHLKDACVLEALLKKISAAAAAAGTPIEQRHLDTIKLSEARKLGLRQFEYMAKRGQFPDCRTIPEWEQ